MIHEGRFLTRSRALDLTTTSAGTISQSLLARMASSVSILASRLFDKGVNKTSFHYIKQADVNYRSRMARFEQPVVAICHVDAPEGSKQSAYYIVSHVFPVDRKLRYKQR